MSKSLDIPGISYGFAAESKEPLFKIKLFNLDACLDCGAYAPSGDFPVYSEANCPRDGSNKAQMWRIKTVDLTH